MVTFKRTKIWWVPNIMVMCRMQEMATRTTWFNIVADESDLDDDSEGQGRGEAPVAFV